MKLIAHRGASLVKQENSVEGLEYAAALGASAVECDIRETKDGVFVIFHDENLLRLTGEQDMVEDLTFAQMQKKLLAKRYALLTFDELSQRYRKKTPILLHVKLQKPDAAFVSMLKASGLPLICGVDSIWAAKEVCCAFPKEKILAFMPDFYNIGAFVENGASIIRLWEPWLSEITPERIKSQFGVKVWVMCRDLMCPDETASMNGNERSLDRIASLGADGALLNDIELGIKWKHNKEGERSYAQHSND